MNDRRNSFFTRWVNCWSAVRVSAPSGPTQNTGILEHPTGQSRGSRLKLLARRELIKTGPVDYAEWNYHPILRHIQRLRFSLALSLLPPRSNRLLEIGYGSGIFLPALKDRANALYGVDIHEKTFEVQSALAKEGVPTNLFKAAAEQLPFSDGFFDIVVAVSALEFVSDLNKTCEEIRRVLKVDGLFIVVTPGHSSLLDFGLRLLTGQSAKKDFGESRRFVVPTLLQNFEARTRTPARSVLSGYVTLYDGLQLSKKNEPGAGPSSGA